MEATGSARHHFPMHPRLSATLGSLLLALLSSACATAHEPCSATDGALAPDAAAAQDAARAPCGAHLVDEGDACVGWRAIPAPPCAFIAMVRIDGAVAVHCDVGIDYALTEFDTWEYVSGASSPVVQTGVGPDVFGFSAVLVAVFPSGARVASHGDVYAVPVAWRTEASGAWRETVPPPSAFLTDCIALSEREALFVGRDAFIFTIERR